MGSIPVRELQKSRTDTTGNRSAGRSPISWVLRLFFLNAFKGPNLSTLDPLTGDRVDLFDPNGYVVRHCNFSGMISGLTPIGATARLLNMNHPCASSCRCNAENGNC